ncbi:MAG: hypothetical protein FWE85_03070 [Clostridiales bacterium]|nr:hypothetical protein [Clostridiales bacterium]
MDSFARLTERLTETYSSYETKTETENGVNYFVIVNPFGGDDIKISCEDGEGIIFYYAFQHAHFDFCGENIDDNIDALIDYINDYLYEKKVSIEFFHGKTALFGGDGYLNDIDTSSIKSLLKGMTGDDNVTLYESLYKQIKGFNCRCSIRGWDPANNKDIDFVL